jgi:hypothetical protein
MIKFSLFDFIAESNHIEDIHTVTEAEILAHKEFLEGNLTIESVEKLVSVVQPGAKIRSSPGMNVYVGKHTPPPGGNSIML